MGKEFPLARKEEEGQSVLLAITSSGEHVTTPYIGDKGTQEPKLNEGDGRREVEDTEAKSQGSRKAKGANVSPAKKDRRRRGNKDRESDRGDEGEDILIGRSAQKLGVVHPSNYCDELETVPHYWSEVEQIEKGVLFQCKFCHDYLWLPSGWTDVDRLTALIKQYGKNEGYCRFLNRHRPAKMLIAKLQDLRRLEAETTDKREFAKMTDKILSDKEYDRPRRYDG